MKKALMFLFLLFVPLFVSAEDIEIKEIKLIEKSEGVEELSPPTYEGIKLNFDLRFVKPDDKAIYEVTLKNTSNEDYLLENEVKFSEDEYIKYDIKFANKTIKAGKEEKATITVSYDKEIPVEGFDNGEYIQTNKYTINLSTGEKNPYTRSTTGYVLIGLLVVSLIVTILLYRRQRALAMFVMALSLIALPFITNALKKVSFEVDTKIHITDRCYTLDTDFGAFDDNDTKSICVLFSENKYVHQEYVFILTAEPRNESDKLYLVAYKTHMTENSYIRVYDLEDNLLKEVKLSDFRKPIVNVNTAVNYAESLKDVVIGNYTRDEVRIEISEDLEDYQSSDVAYLMYGAGEVNNNVKGPWITDLDAIDKIEYLDTYSTIEKGLHGFERDSKDSHLYHAVWAPIQK